VIVGLPTTLGGKRATSSRRAFAADWPNSSVPVETYDERLTTRMAERSAREGARADRDSLAAAHLLESYLASQGNR
jgi:RNase H-fold protein (predicted Holliday junction resolvase)